MVSIATLLQVLYTNNHQGWYAGRVDGTHKIVGVQRRGILLRGGTGGKGGEGIRNELGEQWSDGVFDGLLGFKCPEVVGWDFKKLHQRGQMICCEKQYL